MFRTEFNPETKIWSGVNCSLLYGKDVSVGEVLLNILRKSPTKISQISDNNNIKITNFDMARKTIRTAIRMQNLGIQKDDVVGIVAKNNHNLAPVVFASLIIGAPVNPLDASFNKNDISHMFNLTKPKIIFCDHDVFQTVQSAIDDINLSVIWVLFEKNYDDFDYIEDFFEEIANENDFICPQIGEGDKQPALILCSSGTTGLSKGVILSHAQVLHKFNQMLPNTSDDFFLCYSSIYWLSGSASLLFGTLSGCTRVITTERFSPILFFKMIEKYRITMLIVPPSSIGMLLHCPDLYLADLSSIERLYCGGSACPVYFQLEMNKYIPYGKVLPGYGMTEISGMISVNFNDDKMESVGQLSARTEVKLIDDESNNLNIEESGEICIRSPYNFLGYCNNFEATNDTLDDEGWVHTGDIGYFDEDGYLFIIDRKKDIMKYQNYQISPSEIENLVIQLNGIVAVCVVGIPHDIDIEIPAAVVIKSENFEISSEEIINYVAENMSSHKQLRGGVYFVDTFPMTASGKIQRKKVLEMAIDNYNSSIN